LNYYPFHLGDYAAHTAHLEPMEDLAYRRMLDLYYRTEKALPKDVSAIARLIRMVDCAATVRDVLNEFFTLSDDGWHSKRADDELTEMKTKQEQQATKDEHEADRLRRFRARRAEMFDALRAVGVVPAWDVAMKELQRLFDANCNAPETRMGALSEMDSQRLSLPTPTPTPVEKKPTAAPWLTVPELVADGLSQTLSADWLAHRRTRKAKLTRLAWDGFKAEVSKAGWQLDDAIRKAISRNWTAFEAEWVKTAGFQAVAAVTVPSIAADKTAELLRADEEHRAEVARQRALRQQEKAA